MEKMEVEKYFVIYSRKSRFTGKGESIENQIEMCRQYISRNFGSTAADQAQIYEDEGFSGGNLERPQFKKMMEKAKEGRIAAIVVYRLDRISRNIGDFAGLIRRLEELSVDFISIREQFDTSSPMGRAMMYISSVFSQLERETIAERIRDNMRELAKTGRWLGGMTPTGFQSETVSGPSQDGKIRKFCRLKVVPEEAVLVKMMYRKFLESGSLRQTEDFLLERGLRTKTGREFSRFAVKGILSNPVYMAADEDAFRFFSLRGAELFPGKEAFDGTKGVMAYNRSLQQPGKTNKIRPIQEWIVAAGGHEPLVDGSTWIRVQELLDRNCSHGYRRPRNSQALLTGRLICGACGAHMRPKLSGRKKQDGERGYSYLCTLKEKSRRSRCSEKNANGKAADSAVLEALAGLEEDREVFRRELEKGKRKAAADQRCRAAAQVEEERELRSQAYWTKERIETLRESLSSFQELAKGLQTEDKRRIIGSLTEQIVWDGETLHIFLAGAEGEQKIRQEACGKRLSET